MVPCSSSCPSGTAGDSIAYEYDSAGVENSIGYVTRIQDTTGESRIEEYDERGRAMTTTRVINAPSLDLGATDAQMSFTYNEQDQVTSVTYPDNELVHTFYDASGQPIAVSVQGGETLVSDVLYDVFGRILDLEHGNGVADTRTYYGPSKRHRLETLGSASASTTHLALSYPQYTGRGQIERIFDNRDFTTAPLSNEFNYTYDDLGRLKSATGASLIETYDHDALGNLRAKGNLTFQYDTPTTPHLMTSYGVNNGPQGIPIDHDDNGNRKERGDGEQIYEYDPEDRLTFINLTSEHVRFAYDHAGQMTVKAIGDPTATWTRYYNQYAETTNAGKFTKWYYLGGMRVASKTSSDVSWEVVAAAESPVEFASIWQAGRPVLLVALRPEAQVGGGVFLLLVATGLAVAPWRRKAVAGIAVRKGHVIGVAILFTCSTFPWPLMVRPANACTQGCDCPPPEIRHYHHDHLGSTQVITKDNGDIVEQIRYKPYGEIRGRFGPAGNTLTGPTATPRREFTGYDTEMLSGLEYAGARFYDPVLGSFLTQDPMRQFANPYVYAGSDPTNLTDPDGACVLFGFECLTVALVVAAASATAASIDTGIRTGNAGAAIEAGLIAGVTSFAGAYGLGIIAGPAISQLPAVAQYAIALGGGGYGVSQAVDNGYYATAVVGSFAALLAAYGIAQGANGRPGSNGDQLAAMQSELEPAQASGNSVLSDEQVGNIIFNETRSLSGEGIDSARGELGHTIINADETWGSLRSLHAGSAPSSLPSNFSPTLEGGTLQSIRSTVADVRWSRSLGIDPTRGATNFNLRSYPSPRPPSWAPSLRLQAIHGGFSNTIGPPQYIHIWQNPNAGYPFYGL
jgi:RHS repeat-associated protein